jgi:signal transduction histidine kinase
MERTILVAEDSPTQAEHVRLLLEAEGYRVSLVTNGRDGLARVASAPPDLIISDVVMPEMDGYAFCRAVKSTETLQHIPFVLLTERNSPADIIRGLQVGTDNFITKPFEDEYLLERVRRIFQNLDLRREGHLDVEITLTAGGQQITINADKQQMIELLFATLEQLQREIGERRRAEEDADRANRAKSEFLSRMSHELRTPLNAILGFAQLMEISQLTDRQREGVEHILEGGRHLLALINEVLEISRIESGHLRLSLEPVPVAEIVRAALSLVRPLATDQAIQLEASLPDDGQHVEADRHRLQQVLLNLLSNAVKYNRPSGTVRVTCEPVGARRLRIRVADSGLGMTPEQMELLFTPFERLGAEQTGVEGTGLGLTLSKHLVEAMGGTMDVESQVGVGSVFSVEFALVAAPASSAAVAAAAAPPSRPLRTGDASVLYIEDNVSNLRLLERVLAHRPGLKLLAAAQGRLGLDLARRHRPNLILLDLHLPDLSGADVLQQLRADTATREIPVVIVSADATPGQIDRLLAAGARAYLTKPLDVAKLLTLVDEIVGEPQPPAS